MSTLLPVLCIRLHVDSLLSFGMQGVLLKSDKKLSFVFAINGWDSFILLDL